MDVGSTPTESRAPVFMDDEIEDSDPDDRRDQVVKRSRTRHRNRTAERDSAIGSTARSSDDRLLVDQWARTGVSGKGISILQKDAPHSTSMLAFLADMRLRVPLATAYKAQFVSKNTKKELRGKTFNYERESKEVREGLDISRETEWRKWKDFVAGRPCRGEELQRLLNEGHVPIPTRWVDTDKNAHLHREGGPIIDPEYKSRLCGRGDLEGIDGIRADSPTAEIEAHNLLFSFAAANKLRIKTADISNAYFQSCLLYTSPSPRDGLLSRMPSSA